jgi:lipid A ethanolaminephosphotransferase
MKINYFKVIIIYSLFITLIFNFHLLDFFGTKQGLKYADSFNEVYFFITGYFLIFTTISSTFFLLGQRYLLKPVIIILFFICAVNYYFLTVLGIIIDESIIQSTIDSLNERNWGEINDLLTFRYFIYLFFLGFVPSLLLFFIKIEYPNFKKEITIRLMSTILLFLITLGLIYANYKNISFIARGSKQIKERIIPHYFLSNIKDYYDEIRDANRTFLELKSKAVQLFPKDKMIGVIMVGETARADRFSLNGYKKQTNPLLEKQNIINFNEAYACGTTTVVAVPCMFSLREYEKYNRYEAEYEANALDLIKSSGTEVIWLENNSSCKHVCDRIKTIDYVQKGSEHYVGYGVHDVVILEGLKKVLAENKEKKLLIVLHTMGSHGPAYYNRYTKDFEKFIPTCKSNEPQGCNVEELNNTFDNTILYTDYIISSAIDILKKETESQNFLIYASDHGESLGEKGIYLHGLPMRIAPKEQIHIPTLLWSSDNLKEKRKKISKSYPTSRQIKSKITHENLTHTLLDFFNLKTLYLNLNKSMLSIKDN